MNPNVNMWDQQSNCSCGACALLYVASKDYVVRAAMQAVLKYDPLVVASGTQEARELAVLKLMLACCCCSCCGSDSVGMVKALKKLGIPHYVRRDKGCMCGWNNEGVLDCNCCGVVHWVITGFSKLKAMFCCLPCRPGNAIPNPTYLLKAYNNSDITGHWVVTDSNDMIVYGGNSTKPLPDSCCTTVIALP